MRHLYKLVMCDTIETIIPYYENRNCRRIDDVQLDISQSHANNFKKG